MASSGWSKRSVCVDDHRLKPGFLLERVFSGIHGPGKATTRRLPTSPDRQGAVGGVLFKFRQTFVPAWQIPADLTLAAAIRMPDGLQSRHRTQPARRLHAVVVFGDVHAELLLHVARVVIGQSARLIGRSSIAQQVRAAVHACYSETECVLEARIERAFVRH